MKYSTEFLADTSVQITIWSKRPKRILEHFNYGNDKTLLRLCYEVLANTNATPAVVLVTDAATLKGMHVRLTNLQKKMLQEDLAEMEADVAEKVDTRLSEKEFAGISKKDPFNSLYSEEPAKKRSVVSSREDVESMPVVSSGPKHSVHLDPVTGLYWLICDLPTNFDRVVMSEFFNQVFIRDLMSEGGESGRYTHNPVYYSSEDPAEYYISTWASSQTTLNELLMQLGLWLSRVHNIKHSTL